LKKKGLEIKKRGQVLWNCGKERRELNNLWGGGGVRLVKKNDGVHKGVVRTFVLLCSRVKGHLHLRRGCREGDGREVLKNMLREKEKDGSKCGVGGAS
jgi:hypothetical protein